MNTYSMNTYSLSNKLSKLFHAPKIVAKRMPTIQFIESKKAYSHRAIKFNLLNKK